MRVFVKTAAAAWTQAAPTALFGCACTLIALWHATDAVFAAREQRTAKYRIQQLNLFHSPNHNHFSLQITLCHRAGTLIRLRDAISTVRSLLLEPSGR